SGSKSISRGSCSGAGKWTYRVRLGFKCGTGEKCPKLLSILGIVSQDEVIIMRAASFRTLPAQSPDRVVRSEADLCRPILAGVEETCLLSRAVEEHDPSATSSLS